MRTCPLQFGRALAVLLLAGCVAVPAVAQRGAGQGKAKGPRPQGDKPYAGGAREPRESQPRPQGEKDHPHGLRGLIGVPPPWMERLQEMTPAEQERFLSNNERFRNLPPERQAQIRRRLQHWNSLTPQQRAALRERGRIWQQLTPEQQRRVRDEILPKWQLFPLDRRQVVLKKLRALRDMNESERSAKLNDETFLGGLNNDERMMLRELAGLRVGMAPEASQDSPPPR